MKFLILSATACLLSAVAMPTVGSPLDNLAQRSDAVSRSISAENFTGEPGKGGMSTDGAAAEAARDLGVGWKVSPYILIQPKKTFTLCDIKASGAIKHIWITGNNEKWRWMILRVYWDGCKTPSIEVPLGDFFADPTPETYSPLNSAAVCVNPKSGMNCYWTMPFGKECRITLENLGDRDSVIYYQIDYVEETHKEAPMYFCANFRRTNPVQYKDVYTILDGVNANGQYVGTHIFWGAKTAGWWGEGEIKFYLDGDKKFPTICGTGTEDYFCGAFSFDTGGKYQTYTSLYSGLSRITKPNEIYAANTYFALYRWHITDPIYFKKNIKVTIQALGWGDGGRYRPLEDDISSVAYWYQDKPETNFPALPDRDALKID